MPSRELPIRSALIAFGLLVGIILMELALQAGTLFMKESRGGVPTTWLTGNLRLVFLGDSNTWGWKLERSQAYPKVLEALWNDSGRRPQIEVMNLGYPGMNSSRVARDFSKVLDTFRPDLAFVLIGRNDFWTEPVPMGDSETRSLSSYLWKYSRTYRLFYIAVRGMGSSELQISLVGESIPDFDSAEAVARFGGREIPLGYERRRGRRDPSSTTDSLDRNLGVMKSTAAEFGTKLVLMSYASVAGKYRTANQTLRRVAIRNDTAFIDNAQLFEERCGGENCPELFFPDGHPSAEGHRLMAERIAEWLAASRGS